MAQKLSIVIPVFNEETFIKEILIRINSIIGLKKEIIVVNDCSNDNTDKILESECKNLYTKIIKNNKNMGKG